MESRGKQPLANQAYDHLKAQMLNGELPAGALIDIDAVLAAIGSSRFPVMEALKRLEIEKFVEITPQVGCRVSTPSLSDVTDFLGLFAVIEGYFARLAAQRALPEEIDELQSINDRMRKAFNRASSASGRDEVYRLGNRKFHLMLHTIARATNLNELAFSLWDRGEFLISAGVGTVRFGERVEAALDEHDEIIEALTRRDGTTAGRLAETHLLAFVAEIQAHASKTALAAQVEPPDRG
ncbi:GntR family transcriptional regulator [Pigmentiphaga sp.]|uniref:GntR family transcriptional regulator n=1 Tax=Pigmentiphaga sp. TaxID=1977564 RepID=UPI00128B0059|nr:GntR family transcriptional regulator [Pigmentiphaga sp.]MPS26651.1 GntR family transcriptional regulator [Alcaligenaceae bacterium SAGV5]MPS53677.1 GntR family transcriptional regulator [Alcaligenaceae bacterium SAGV3]MPT59252.1 GntR family transcriptional regulator [Alcaligenaceae bacterium]